MKPFLGGFRFLDPLGGLGIMCNIGTTLMGSLTKLFNPASFKLLPLRGSFGGVLQAPKGPRTQIIGF